MRTLASSTADNKMLLGNITIGSGAFKWLHGWVTGPLQWRHY